MSSEMIGSNLTGDKCFEHFLDEEYGLRRRNYFIALYLVLFAVGAIGNISVILSLLQLNRSRVKILMLNLSIADVVVTFIMIPLEVIRRVSFVWSNSEISCKTVQTLRVFGPYLSSMVLICIGLDRYFVITRPVRLNNNRFHFKACLVVAWVVSIVFSIPESVVFQLEQHPACPLIYRCEFVRYFSSEISSSVFRIMKLLVLYFIPLIIISICYILITIHVVRQSNIMRILSLANDGVSTVSGTAIIGDTESQSSLYSNRLSCNRTLRARLQKSKRRTIRMTFIIVSAFVFCWTPYTFMSLWSVLFPQSFQGVDPVVKDSLLLLALSNSCINPMIYGTHFNVIHSMKRAWSSLK